MKLLTTLLLLFLSTSLFALNFELGALNNNGNRSEYLKALAVMPPFDFLLESHGTNADHSVKLSTSWKFPFTINEGAYIFGSAEYLKDTALSVNGISLGAGLGCSADLDLFKARFSISNILKQSGNVLPSLRLECTSAEIKNITLSGIYQEDCESRSLELDTTLKLSTRTSLGFSRKILTNGDKESYRQNIFVKFNGL